MKASHLALTLVLSAAVAFGTVKLAAPTATTEAKKETAFERVMRTNTLHCGYIVSPPFIAMDMKTGEKSGVAVEYVEAIGRELGIKILWDHEIGWGNFDEGLRTGRYDALCMPLWETGQRAKMGLFTQSLYDSDLSLIARADDSRFDGSINKTNQADVTVATVEGDLSRQVKERLFPKAKELALPSGIDDGQYFLNITTRKADVGFAFRYRIEEYNKHAEDKLAILDSNGPLQSYGTAIIVAQNEINLKFLLDSAIHALLKNGTAQSILAKYPGVSVPSMKGPVSP